MELVFSPTKKRGAESLCVEKTKKFENKKKYYEQHKKNRI